MSRHGAPDGLAPLPRRRVLSIAAGVVAMHLGLWVHSDRLVPPWVPPPAGPSVVWMAWAPPTQQLPSPPPSPPPPPPAPARRQVATPASQGPVPQGSAASDPPQQPRPPALALPPPFEWRFTVYRGPAIVSGATLQFQLDSLPQPRYDLRWTETAATSPSLAWHSLGAVGPSGLIPHRLVESRQGRDRRAINVDPDAGWVSASASTHREPAPPGVQDRLSWLVQFLAQVSTCGASWRVGESITLAVAQWDGRVTPWQFVLRDAHGHAPGLCVWERLPTQDYDAAVQVWLHPQGGYRPLRVIWQWAPHPEVTRWEAQD